VTVLEWELERIGIEDRAKMVVLAMVEVVAEVGAEDGSFKEI